MRQSERDFRGHFVIHPFVPVRGPRIRVGFHQPAGLQEMLAKKNVRPQIGIGRVFGKLENREA